MEKNKKAPTDQAKEFMASNWWILWVVILFVFIYDFFVNADISKKYQLALDKIDKASKGVVMLDYSGRVVYVDKRTIDSTNIGFQSAVKNALRFYLIKDWQTLSQNYKEKINSPEDIERNCPDILEFKNNYLKDVKEANSNYAAYIKTLTYLITTDNLPEKIIATDSKITDYQVNQNTFNITIVVDVAQSVYLIESDKTIDKTGSIEIKATGEFDTENGTPVNPLGIKFTSFKPTYSTKR
jgi:hypothetical protein